MDEVWWESGKGIKDAGDQVARSHDKRSLRLEQLSQALEPRLRETNDVSVGLQSTGGV